MRYYSLEIGKQNFKELVKLFNLNIQIYVLVSGLFLIIAETIGLYLMYNVLQIPQERFNAALILFHLSVLSCVTQILLTPYSAAIIAKEQMSFYGYIGIVEALSKLIIAIIICNTSFDKLIIYGGLLLLMYILLLIIYACYSKKNISFCRYKFVKDKEKLKGILSFSGWSLFESVTDILSIQGISLLLNVFIGVVINAAAGIASQVVSVVWGFICNFQTAFKPQIIKYYSVGDRDNYVRLLYQTSKLSFFLYYVIALPLVCNLPVLLSIWLQEVPDYSVNISRVVIINLIFGTLSAPIWILIQAQGNIRKYQLYVTSVMLLNFPFAFILLLLGFNPVVIFISKGFVAFLTYISRLAFLKKQFDISIKEYLLKVVKPLLFCSMLAALPTLLVYYLTSDYTQLLISTFVSLIFNILLFYFVGLDSGEKAVIKLYARRFSLNK